MHRKNPKTGTESEYLKCFLVTPFVTPFVKISYIIPCYSMLYYDNETLIIYDKY